MTQVFMVVWNHIRDHWLLMTKGQKISLGKYQQFVYAGLRTHHLHSLKGFFFSIACVKFGYWQFKPTKVVAKPKAKPKKLSESAIFYQAKKRRRRRETSGGRENNERLHRKIG